MWNPFKKKEAPPPLKSWGQKAVFGMGLLVALAILGPIAYAAFQTLLFTAGAAVMGVSLFLTLLTLPAITRWWKILVLKMMKASARLNPVETLQADLLKRQAAHKAARSHVTKIVGQKEALRERLDDLQRVHKQTDPALERMYVKLDGLAGRLEASVQRAGGKVQEFERFVAFHRDRWEVAKSTGELARMLKDVNGGDVTDKFLADTAIDTIRTELATSFAEINEVLSDEDMRTVAPDVTLIDVTPAMPMITSTAPQPVLIER